MSVRVTWALLLFFWICLVNIAAASDEIAPFNKALTLTLVETPDGIDTLLVTGRNGDTLTAVNLSDLLHIRADDPLLVFSEIGPAKLRSLLNSETAEFRVSDLVIPRGLSSQHMAAAANYKAHGAEGGLDSVFLFPKYSLPTDGSFSIPVCSGQLMDYEIEICARFDRQIQSMEDFSKAHVGLFLCGDFTDRATLMRKIDKENWESGAGYTDAKSGAGLFPIGPLVVVPDDWSSFIQEIELKLTVNGGIRQQSSAAEMRLNLAEIMALALAPDTSMHWSFGDQPIALLEDDTLYRGQSILTGTPEGVVFRPPDTLFIATSVFNWVLSGSFLKGGVTDFIIEKYIDDRLSAKTYLQPGDKIAMSATYLGEVRIDMVAAE